MNLPTNIALACAPLFEQLPIEQAMPRLVGSHPTHSSVVEQVASDPAIAAKPELVSALWLYVSDLGRSHTISQGIDGSTGAFWHGIMHRREGDFSNSHYWMRQASSHPLISESPDLDPNGFIDLVSSANGADTPELVARQREEWQALFEWCAR